MIKKKSLTHTCFSGQTDKCHKLNKEVFLNLLIIGNNKTKLLDLGCSDGEFTKKIASVIGTDKIYGVDIDKTSALKARKNGIIVKISDLNKRFPFPDEIFDVITSNQLLEHLWNTENFFKEVNRVLKMGGSALISTVNLSSLPSIFFILLGQQSPIIHLTDIQVGNYSRGKYVSNRYHQKAFNIPALKDLSEYYGFKLELIKGSGFYFLPLSVQKLLSRILSRYAVYLTMRIRKIERI
jgi:2-polyprenyl-3-methyl-5-hydroxy-6-metoxy-1,4-benzoquinol methylase